MKLPHIGLLGLQRLPRESEKGWDKTLSWYLIGMSASQIIKLEKENKPRKVAEWEYILHKQISYD